MPGYINIHQRYTDWNAINLNGEEYEVLDPKQMFLDLLKYKNRPIEWDQKTILLVGPQNSGKTVLIRYLVHLIRNNPDNKGLVSVVRTNDLRIIGDKRYSQYFLNEYGDPYKVLVIIVDDAIKEGFESRRSLSGPNVAMTQQFCITRHILEENYSPNGIIFMIFAAQIFSRIDATIRNTAQLQIFTSYYDQSWFHNLFNPEEAEVMRIATYEGMFSSNFDARRFAIAKTLTGDVATIEVPFSNKNEVLYPYVDRTIDKDMIINRLSNVLLEKITDISEFTKGELKGFLGLEAKKIESDYCTRLSKSDLTTAIDRASFISKLKTMGSHKDIDVSEKITILGKNGKFQISCPFCDHRQIYKPHIPKKIFSNPRTDCQMCGHKFYIKPEELFTRQSTMGSSNILGNYDLDLKSEV